MATIELILTEDIHRLGNAGDVVKVKAGYGRNFLLPQGKALRATKDNRSKFEGMKVQLEARNLELKTEADKIGGKLDGKTFVVLRQASEVGQLYGSVSARDIASILSDGGYSVTRNQIALHAPIKMIGMHTVPVALHPEVEVKVTVNVARNADEADRQARGEDMTQRREEADEEAEIAAQAAAVFEKPEDAERDQGTGEEEK